MTVVTPSKSLRGPRLRIRDFVFHDVQGLVSISFVIALIAIALLAPWVAPYSPLEQDYRNMLAKPDAAHWLGTDDLGRDVLSRLIHGAAPALFGSLLAVSIGAAIGVPIGLVAGFSGRWVDSLLGRVIDALMSFPTIILAIGVTGMLGGGLVNGMIAIGIACSPRFARLARARALVVKSELYVDAARGFGATPGHIVLRHIMPNAIQPVIVQTALLLSNALLAEASLSFLGLGVLPPQASWGGMLARAYYYMEIAPTQLLAPGLAIMFTALAFNGTGDTIRKVLDPKTRNN